MGNFLNDKSIEEVWIIRLGSSAQGQTLFTGKAYLHV
jgi:hypothetical protein